jgi:aminomethyltransferase
MKSPLHTLHEELGATFTSFEGHTMPLKYTSIQEEHMAVRHHVGIFDVSHMGAILVSGSESPNFVGKVTTCNPDNVDVGMGFYTAILRENGTIIDDEVFLRICKDEYLFIPNAGRHEIVSQWFQDQANVEKMQVTITNRSTDYAILAVQGPQSTETLQEMVDVDIKNMKLFSCCSLPTKDVQVIISRTGYTGEKGYELYIRPGNAGQKWYKNILANGTSYNIQPIGLGARDTLRLEKAFALAGNEFAGGRTPLEAGLNWAIHWDHQFIGKEALEMQREGTYDHLTFLECTGRGVPRTDQQVQAEGRIAGVVSSGSFSPCLRKGIAMAYIHPDFEKVDNYIIVAGEKNIVAKKVNPPFVKKDQC